MREGRISRPIRPRTAVFAMCGNTIPLIHTHCACAPAQTVTKQIRSGRAPLLLLVPLLFTLPLLPLTFIALEELSAFAELSDRTPLNRALLVAGGPVHDHIVELLRKQREKIELLEGDIAVTERHLREALQDAKRCEAIVLIPPPRFAG